MDNYNKSSKVDIFGSYILIWFLGLVELIFILWLVWKCVFDGFDVAKAVSWLALISAAIVIMIKYLKLAIKRHDKLKK